MLIMISSKTGSQEPQIWLILKVELFIARVLKFPSHPIKYFSLFIASQLAVVQLAHFELIPSIREELLSKSLSLKMIALLTGIIHAANWEEIIYEFSNAFPGN